jgi:guanylate kinase
MIVSAPSGTGKTTLCRLLLKSEPEITFSVSYTTRSQRAGEIDGKDYHFISNEEFKRMDENGDFLETEAIFNHFYGTSGKDINKSLAKGKNILLDVDTKGAKNLKHTCPEGVFVFILPPSLGTLKRRLAKRGSEDEKNIRLRMEKACEEIHENHWYDYVIVNDIINDSLEALKSIYIAEKHRRKRQTEVIEKIIRSKRGGI